MINVYTLDNGLRIVMETIPFVRSVSFGIWVQNGSRQEDTQTSGVSHFIEHMLFKGTEKRTAKAIADDMAAVGGQINAFTSKECTCYSARTLDMHFDVALDVLTDMFFHSRFDEAEVKKERNVILEEINMYEDTPEELVQDLLQSRVWPRNPLGYPVLGTPQSIGGFDGEFIRQYFKGHYTPEKTVIAIAGNLDEARALEKIQAAFANFAGAAAFPAPEPAVYSPAFATREKDIEQVHLTLGFPGIPNGSDDLYAMAAVNTLFGGGINSRLFQTIREEHGLAYDVGSFNAGFSDTGLFTVYAAVNPAQTHEVFQLIINEIKRMFTERVTKQQLASTREQLKSGYLLSLESSASRMNSIGRTLLMLNKTITPEELIEKIDAVDLDAFYALCEKVLKLDQISVAMVGRDIEGSMPRCATL